MNGYGAWHFGYYEYGMVFPTDEAQKHRVKCGLLAFKHALIDNGYEGINLSNGVFGTVMKEKTIEFQNANGLTRAAGYTPGRIGSTVARYLFRHYSYAAETAHAIPDHLVQKIGCQESSHDPVAQGFYDDLDEGWAQEHMPYHPELMLEDAWTPSLIIPKVGDELVSNYVSVGHDWDGAVAAHNIGTVLAHQWVQAGKPGSGGPILYGVDAWTRATGYVAAIRAMPV